MRSMFERGPGEEALTLAEALGKAPSGCPATGMLSLDVAELYEETAPACSPLRRREMGVTLLSGLD